MPVFCSGKGDDATTTRNVSRVIHRACKDRGQGLKVHHHESWGVKAHVLCIDFDGGDCSLSTSCGIGLACISCHEGVSGRLAGMQCRKKKKKKVDFCRALHLVPKVDGRTCFCSLSEDLL